MKIVDGRVDLIGWTIGQMEAGDKFHSLAMECVRGVIEEVLRQTFEQRNLEQGYFFWNNCAMTRPLEFHLNLRLSRHETPELVFDLRECFSREMEECAADGSYAIDLKRLSGHLKTLVSEIDTLVAAVPAEQIALQEADQR